MPTFDGSTYYYMLVMDAGSTGTRMYVNPTCCARFCYIAAILHVYAWTHGMQPSQVCISIPISTSIWAARLGNGALYSSTLALWYAAWLSCLHVRYTPDQ